MINIPTVIEKKSRTKTEKTMPHKLFAVIEKKCNVQQPVAPTVQIEDDYYEKLTPNNTEEINKLKS